MGWIMIEDNVLYKKSGIYADLLIHPGETILDVINGKKDISRGFAVGLEYALSIPSSFWLNLQANYDSELISLQKNNLLILKR